MEREEVKEGEDPYFPIEGVYHNTVGVVTDIS